VRLQLIAALTAIAVAPSAPAIADDEPWAINVDTLVYSDTDNVDVVSPQVGVRRELADGEGSVGARVVVDVISAASVDVVSQASQRFSEVRTEADLSASLPVAGFVPSVSYRYSHEPDYESHGGRLGVERRLGSADTTLSFGYGLTVDRVGMSGTPSSVFSERLTTHSGDVGITQVIDRRTLVRLVYSLTAQQGYMEKPYRLVPLFDDAGLAMAEADGVALDLDSFDAYRLASKPPEEVPDDRYRHAVALRALHYLPSMSSSLRVDYRFYVDSWGITAHTLEPALYREIGESWRVNAFARLYRQSAASFWQRTYRVSDPAMAPRWRTVDKSLSPFASATAGLRGEWQRGDTLSAYAEVSAAYTRFEDYLFLDDRLAVMSLLGLRWTP
jgi:hypothetical protein